MAHVLKKIEMIVSIDENSSVLKISNSNLEMVANLKLGTIRSIFPSGVEIESLTIKDS